MKRTIARILTIVMAFALFLPVVDVFADKDLDVSALNLFLNKFANMDRSQRELGAALLEEYLSDGAKGIDDLKDALDIFITGEQEESLKKYGYTLNDVKNELDRLKNWNASDISKLVQYIKQGDISKIESIILTNEGNKKDTNKDNGDSKSDRDNATDKDNAKESNTPAEKLLEIKFTDIDNNWAKEHIVFLAERGIIKGKSEYIFDPNGSISRAEFVSLIVRLFNLEPDNGKAMNFDDVKPDSWYYLAVKAAYDNKVINGISERRFEPNKNITREEIITIIIRILESKGLLFGLDDTGKDLGLFNDKDEISSWAIDSMSKAVKYGILGGRPNNTLAPKDVALRSEAASIIMSLYLIINN